MRPAPSHGLRARPENLDGGPPFPTTSTWPPRPPPPSRPARCDSLLAGPPLPPHDLPKAPEVTLSTLIGRSDSSARDPPSSSQQSQRPNDGPRGPLHCGPDL